MAFTSRCLFLDLSPSLLPSLPVFEELGIFLHLLISSATQKHTHTHTHTHTLIPPTRPQTVIMKNTLELG